MRALLLLQHPQWQGTLRRRYETMIRRRVWIFRDDDINTDLIFPGKYTYEPLRPEEQAIGFINWTVQGHTDYELWQQVVHTTLVKMKIVSPQMTMGCASVYHG